MRLGRLGHGFKDTLVKALESIKTRQKSERTQANQVYFTTKCEELLYIALYQSISVAKC